MEIERTQTSSMPGLLQRRICGMLSDTVTENIKVLKNDIMIIVLEILRCLKIYETSAVVFNFCLSAVGKMMKL